MKRAIFLLYVTCMAVCAHANDSDLIHLTLLEEGQEDYVFSLRNNTKDSLYLFDGYFEKCYDGYIYTSMYVHRYDKESKTYKLSLLPILPEIGINGCLNDRVVNGKDKIVKCRQMAFTFTTIAPQETLIVNIKKEAFQSLLYVNDIHPENLSCFHHMTPKMKAKKLKQLPREIIFELGVYTKVDNLLKWCNEADLDDVDRQATAMIVASVPIRICK